MLVSLLSLPLLEFESDYAELVVEAAGSSFFLTVTKTERWQGGGRWGGEEGGLGKVSSAGPVMVVCFSPCLIYAFGRGDRLSRCVIPGSSATNIFFQDYKDLIIIHVFMKIWKLKCTGKMLQITHLASFEKESLRFITWPFKLGAVFIQFLEDNVTTPDAVGFSLVIGQATFAG